mmetsp:Transcript_90347/g.292142  ORF Transcript_90347/g.292142 Transcript_90347/m.292142 type:complete len:295 (+) Transcript_90347:55-939(+)
MHTGRMRIAAPAAQPRLDAILSFAWKGMWPSPPVFLFFLSFSLTLYNDLCFSFFSFGASCFASLSESCCISAGKQPKRWIHARLSSLVILNSGRSSATAAAPSAPSAALAAASIAAALSDQGLTVASSAAAGSEFGSNSKPCNHFSGGGGAAAAPAASATPSLPLPSLPFGFTSGLLPSREPRVIILHTPHRSSPVDCTTSPRRSCFHGCRRQNTPPVPQAWYFGSAAAAISPTGCEQQPALIAAFTSVRCSASSGQALGTAFRQPAGHSEVSKRSTPPASKISSFNRSMVNGV